MSCDTWMLVANPWIVEVNLTPIWRRQSGNLARGSIWPNLPIWKAFQSGQSEKSPKDMDATSEPSGAGSNLAAFLQKTKGATSLLDSVRSFATTDNEMKKRQVKTRLGNRRQIGLRQTRLSNAKNGCQVGLDCQVRSASLAFDYPAFSSSSRTQTGLAGPKMVPPND